MVNDWEPGTGPSASANASSTSPGSEVEKDGVVVVDLPVCVTAVPMVMEPTLVPIVTGTSAAVPTRPLLSRACALR